jgi:hypothetical protein
VSRSVLLRLVATATTVVALLASAGYVAAHPKDDRAPLQPPVAKPSPTPVPVATGRIRIQPGVRATEVPGVTNTHVS